MGLTILVAISTSVLATLICAEFSQWRPPITSYILSLAVRILPPSKRERFREEWAAHLDEVPGDVSQVIVAIGFCFAARKISIRMAAWERIIAASALIFLAPFMVLMGVTIAFTGNSPFRRIRQGDFVSTKFNTDRLKVLESILNRTSLDELPKLIDILDGRSKIGLSSLMKEWLQKQ